MHWGERSQTIAICGGVGVACLLVYSAWGAQADFGVGYVREHRSNIDERPGEGVDEDINVAIAGLSYADDSANLSARVTAQAEYRDYATNFFADETLFLLDASAIYTLSPGRLTWSISDAFREVTFDPTQAPLPANRGGANVFETGPDAFFRASSTQTFSLGARYGNVYVEDTDLDNDRYGASARWIYQAAPQTHYSLNIEHLKADYDEPTYEDFERVDAFFRFQTRRAHAEITLDAGASEIDRERSETLRGSLARAAWRQDLTSVSTAGATASVGYQELGSELLRYVTPPTTTINVTPPPIPVIDVITNDIYYSRQADIFYSNHGSRVLWNVRATARDIDFESPVNEDREEAGGSGDIIYYYSGATTVGLYGSRMDIDYATSRRRDEETQAWLRVGYRAQRHFTISLDVGRVERDSTDPAREFVDDRVMLSLLWSTGPLFMPIGRSLR